MKKILIALATGSALLAASSAQAQSQNFNVTVSLTSACTLTVPSDVAFTYTSFQAAPAVAAGGAFNVTCTNGLPYTFSLDAAAGTVIGLNYTLGLSAAGGTGNGLAQGYSVTGGMVAGQAGTCATAGPCLGSDVRQLTVTF